MIGSDSHGASGALMMMEITTSSCGCGPMGRVHSVPPSLLLSEAHGFSGLLRNLFRMQSAPVTQAKMNFG
ncbi:hypothetical protein FQZ97_1212580 [compost metagenome]